MGEFPLVQHDPHGAGGLHVNPELERGPHQSMPLWIADLVREDRDRLRDRDARHAAGTVERPQE